MNNVAGTTHQTHLQSQDFWIIAFVGEDEPDDKAVGDLGEAQSPRHVATRVDQPVARETLI